MRGKWEGRRMNDRWTFMKRWRIEIGVVSLEGDFEK
jgi:hypothetical protein